MIQIIQTFEHGYTVYNFSANNTEYTVLTKDGTAFDVYSSRIGRAGRTPPKCYTSVAELAARSKAMSDFTKLIA